MRDASLNVERASRWERLFGAVWFAVFVFAIISQNGVAHAAERLDLQTFRGKVVLIDFWASWCGPCRQSFPWMNDMHAKYLDDDLVIVAVNVDNEPDLARAFLDENPAQFRVHFDADKSLVREYEVEAMPSSVLIGRDGQIIARHLGFKSGLRDEYEAALRAALGVEN